MKRSIARICAIALSIVMALTITNVQFSFADMTRTAPGGEVASGDVSAAEAAFHNEAAVTKSGAVMTITLSRDLTLDAPVQFIKGASGDKVVLDLNGHELSAMFGMSGDDIDAARGNNAIEIQADEFDVEIKGPGRITGGKGAIYESENHFKSGADGGAAVEFVHSEYYPNADNGKLEYGLNVTGGAELIGGDGGDMTSEEWLYNIAEFTGSRSDHPHTTAGSGGAGISQENSGLLSGPLSLVYAKISVEDGVVTGGKGGNFDMSEFTPTEYALMTSSAAETVMADQAVSDYARNVTSVAGIYAGRGGDGIKTGVGRMYINVGENSTVSGSSCGGFDFGSNKTINRLGGAISYGGPDNTNQFNVADAGNGIAIWAGDIGLTRDVEGYTGDGWQAKSETSDDMGIYVAGTVKGGNAPEVAALDEDGADGGAGIALYGDAERFACEDANEYHRDWGIIDIEGTVSGGNGGSSITGAAGSGGEGIYESYNVNSGDNGTNYYIVNGEVTGGDGGNTCGLTDFFGSAGNGMHFSDTYRCDLNIAGNGKARSGDAGKAVDHGSLDVENSTAKAIYLNPLADDDYAATYNNTVTIAKETGSGGQGIEKDPINVKASMTSFSGYPTTATKLSCQVEKPAGYTGEVYVVWTAITQLQSNTPEACVIEPSGNDGKSFHLLSNDDYKYLAYEGYDYEAVRIHKYTMGVATTERISEILAYNGSTAKIFCKVVLEDGSWGQSNMMEFTKDGWDDPSGPSAADQEAADAVINMINALPANADLTIDDAAAVTAARDAYDGLTAAQKALIPQEVLEALESAETRMSELDQIEADRVAMYILERLRSLPDYTALDPENVEDAAVIAEAKQALQEAVAAYNGLTAAQSELLNDIIRTSLDEAVNSFNNAFPDQAIEPPKDPEPEILELKGSMVTVGDMVYTGKYLKPAVTVEARGKLLQEGTDYTIVYSNNKNVGAGIVTITGTGDYTGTVDVAFNIKPKAAAIKTPKRGKTYITAKWKAQKSKMSKKRITGYEIQIAKDAEFTDGARTVIRTGYKKTSKKITKLTRNGVIQ
ncbi:MAG: hypothetical protein Q4A65_02060 [Bacillota bacterium]|nr:hypothetical protein [Bacillota bacterium]